MAAPRRRSTPKYYTVKRGILRLIDGAPPGTLLPTERELAGEYRMSRATIRQAISELVAEGVLDRTQGRGTFVARPRVTLVRQLTSFSEDITAQGLEVSSRILACDRVPGPAEVTEALELPPRSAVVRILRIRMADEERLAHELAYVPGRFTGLRRPLERRGSLYATLKERYGVDLAEAEDTIETALAGPEDVRLLDTEMGSPLLVVSRVARDRDGQPVEFTRSVFRGDRFRFVARRVRAPDPDPDSAGLARAGGRR